ncbi:hypothetical protein Ari01nite_33410 [Paractinoplanes rishiriensis]|uniref:Uncharacterized protein n=1 Tax=Paractinoplanes rishiriensis TaxID=1050105 RepID=A0A919K3C4_9ACTN|nr:hypothetical protein Ari01nite_33410 [Actinoplanes rishiriensis]
MGGLAFGGPGRLAGRVLPNTDLGKLLFRANCPANRNSNIGIIARYRRYFVTYQ